MNKEEWINKVMQSMEGHEKPIPSPELFSKIKNSIEPALSTDKANERKVSMPIARFAIAASLVLFMANIFILSNETEVSYVETETSLLNDYNLYE